MNKNLADQSHSSGNLAEAEKLFPLVYKELHALAVRYMQTERVGHTLQPTALLHEAYLKMVGSQSSGVVFRNLEHFIALVAMDMRRILVNHAKFRNAKKRSGSYVRLHVDDVVDDFEQRSIDLVELDEILVRLKEMDPFQHELVELRFFGGLTIEQCARVLGVSVRTAHYEWAFTRAWLRQQLSPT